MTPNDISPAEWDRYNRGALDQIVHKVSKIDSLATAITALMQSQAAMQADMREMSNALRQLAVVEERQQSDRDAMKRAFAEIEAVQANCVAKDEALSVRIAHLELAEADNAKARWAITGVVVAIVSAVGWMVLASVGIRKP